MPKTEEGRILGRQLLRSGTSVAANYRAACRAKSQDDFVYKLGNVVEEVDESLLWLELIEEGSICPATQLASIKSEGDQLLRILQSSLTTAKRNAGR
jgi:four helix bundle protein